MNENESNSNNCQSIGYNLIDRQPIENTPFEGVKWENNPYFLALGNYKLPVKGETIEELKNNLEVQKWEVITSIIGISLQIANTQKNGN